MSFWFLLQFLGHFVQRTFSLSAFWLKGVHYFSQLCCKHVAILTDQGKVKWNT